MDTRSSIIVISDTDQIIEAVRGAVSTEQDIDVSVRKDTLNRVNGAAVQLARDNDLVVFRLRDEHDHAAVRALREKIGGEGKLLALSDAELKLSEALALRKAGVDEILPYPAEREELRDLILALTRKAPQLPALAGRGAERRLGQVLAVCPARGGVGSSTIAINLADQLQQKTGLLRKTTGARVAVVDLDLQFGSVSAALDMAPSEALFRMATEKIVPDRTFVDQAMVEHASGLWVLTAPKQFLPVDALARDQVDALIGHLQQEFDYVVVDFARTLVDWIAPVVSRASRILMVTDTTVPAIRQAQRLIGFFGEERFDPPVDIVINRERKPIISAAHHAAAAKTLGRDLKYWLPDDPKPMRQALDRGVLLSEAASGSSVMKGLRGIARAIVKDSTTPQSVQPRA
jgi:pilus assembly protein CpaE